MKWFYLPVALTVASGCATAPAPVAVRPEAPAVAAAPAAFDYSAIAFSDEFKPVAAAPVAAPVAIYEPGSVEPGFSDAAAQPPAADKPAAKRGPTTSSRARDGEGSLVARSR